MKEDIEEASHTEETGNQGKEDDNQGAQDGTTMPAHMSFDVWHDMHQFITRKQMADRVSLACSGLKELCWPRLHGNRVTPHMVEPLVFLKGTEEGGQTKALLYIYGRRHGEPIPIATGSPLPDYIQGFKLISIRYLDSQVLQFIHNISPLLANTRLSIYTLHNLRTLLDTLNGCATIACLDISIDVSISELRQQFPGLLENIPAISITRHHTDQSGLNELIVTKGESGKSFILNIQCWPPRFVVIGNRIRNAFQTAKQPQSFYIALSNYVSTQGVFQMANEETGEVLALERSEEWKYEMYRCPSGEVEQWREEAKKLLKPETYTAWITYCVE